MLFVSTLLGGRIQISPWRTLPIDWFVWLIALAALVVLRRRIAPGSLPLSHLFEKLRQWFRLPSTKLALHLALWTRVAIFAGGLLAVNTLGHDLSTGPPPPNEVAYLPGRWDAGWYVGLAAGGYRWDGRLDRNARIAFFPAYPMSVRAVGRVLHLPQREPPWLWCGAILSTIYFWLALAYLHRLAEMWIGAARAGPAILIAALYPFSFFFGQMYSESLFLLCAVAGTFYVMNGQPARAFWFGLVAGLTRPTGVLVSLLLIGAALWARRNRPADARANSSITTLFAIASPALGTALYSIYLRWLTGHWLAWLTAQEGWGRTIQDPMMLVTSVATSLRAVGLTGYVHARPYDAINLAAALFAFAMLFLIWRRLGLWMTLFAAASLLAPLRVGGLVSMERYTAVIFPMFLAYATLNRHIVIAWAIVFWRVAVVVRGIVFADRAVF